MLKYALVFFCVITTAFCEERQERRQKHTHKQVDPFALLESQISHTLAYHYLWPWSQLVRAAAGLDLEENLEPQIISNYEKFQVNLNVKKFKPDELRVKVKNRDIVVEGKRKETSDDKHFMANHFVQRFVLPPGSKQEEVTAVLNENGVLSVTVPKHELPPPPPEREVPIEVRLLEPTTEKEKVEVTTEQQQTTEKKIESIPTSSVTPLEQLDLVEATTHVGKIRKKELKDTTKSPKDNEVTKGVNGNDLDYASDAE